MSDAEKPDSEKKPDQDKDSAELSESINALENILSSQVSTTADEVLQLSVPEIPVLDDLVEQDEEHPTSDNSNPLNDEVLAVKPHQEPLSSPLKEDSLDVDDLMLRIDDKLEKELDSLLELLKDTIKQEILTELRIELEGTKRSNNRVEPDQGE